MYTFDVPLVHGTLIKRYKRFLADIKLDDGREVVAHCTNSGSMKTCIEEGAEVYLSPAKDPTRKTPYTWEMIKIDGHWVGINTMVPNALVYNAIKMGLIEQLKGYDEIKREVRFEDSRFDVHLQKGVEQCFVEIKNVTMKVGDAALFPDAVTTRGRKHLETLVRVKEQGMRALMVYVIQRMDVHSFGCALEIDPEYANALQVARQKGVEVIALQAKVSPAKIEIVKELEFK